MQKLKEQKGITLIALVITIIVMLILVGVSVTVALNGGLFSTAQGAARSTETERDKELALSDGRVEIGGSVYNSIEEYTNPASGNGGGASGTVPETYKTTIEGLAEGVSLVPYSELTGILKTEVDNEKVIAVLKETINGTETIAVVPKGFEIINGLEGTKSISAGLVIQDAEENEFVWIPVTTDFDFTERYSIKTDYGDYSEPIELISPVYEYDEDGIRIEVSSKTDSQDTLDYYYGEGYYDYPETANVNNTFAYAEHYLEMVDSVNKYNGFYIGRYETTIDGNSIGSKENTTVLSADMTMAQTNNKAVRWWGLYAAQRKSNVAGNGSTVQTNMIWGQQWDAMITYFGSKDYSETTVETLATSGKQNAGQAKYTYNSEEISDEICNIYDLRGNTFDWTAEAGNTVGRALRGRLLLQLYPFSVLSQQPRSEQQQRRLWFSPSTLYKITKLFYISIFEP